MTPDFTGSNFAGANGLRISANPFGGPQSMPVGEDLPGQARVMEEARPKDAAGPKRPRTGLLPMRPGAQYSIFVKRAQMDRTDAQKRIVVLQRALRLAQQKEANAEAAYLAAAPVAGAISDEAAAFLKATNERGAIANLYAKVTRAAGRNPHEVVCAIAQDPALMAEAFADPAHPPLWICMHDKCKGQKWGDVRELQNDHGDADRKQEAHVYGLWSEAPIDPSAPVVGVLGLIAPFSTDGTPVTRYAEAFAAQAAEGGGLPGDEPVEPVDMAAVLAEAEAAKGTRRRAKGDAS
jgi:hypothetical protein